MLKESSAPLPSKAGAAIAALPSSPRPALPRSNTGSKSWRTTP